MNDKNSEKMIEITNMGFKEINPVDFGEQICLPGHYYGPHARSYYLLHYVVSGKGTFIRNDICYKS